MSQKCCSGDGKEGKTKRRWRKDGVWQSCVWKMMCVKDGVRKMVCDKAVCERWCVTKLCVKDCVCDKVVWKMVCQRWCERWCVKDGGWQSCVCERWCVKDVCQRGCVKDGVRSGAVMGCDVISEVWEVELWWESVWEVRCENWSCDELWCDKWGVRCDVISEVWEVELWWVSVWEVRCEKWSCDELWWVVMRSGAAPARAAARPGGSVYCACHTKGSRGPAAPTRAAARPGGSVYCACHTKGSEMGDVISEVWGAVMSCGVINKWGVRSGAVMKPATRKAAAVQRRPRAPQLDQEARVGAAGPRLPFVWQAQYTEPPGRAAARVGAAGPRLPFVWQASSQLHFSHLTY